MNSGFPFNDQVIKSFFVDLHKCNILFRRTETAYITRFDVIYAVFAVFSLFDFNAVDMEIALVFAA